jgi:hypothetical protein
MAKASSTKTSSGQVRPARRLGQIGRGSFRRRAAIVLAIVVAPRILSPVGTGRQRPAHSDADNHQCQRRPASAA